MEINTANSETTKNPYINTPENAKLNTYSDPKQITQSSTNSNVLICPVCHIQVRQSDYFCFNCGTNLKPAPLPTTANAQATLYLKSIILPPMGLIWGFRYLKQKDKKSRITGLIAIGITVALIFYLIKFTIELINTVNETVNSTMGGFYGY